MPEADFKLLRSRLLDGGVAPRHVVRIVSELSDHQEDLELEAMRQVDDPDSARAQARERIGAPNTIALQVLGHPELKRWSHRFPRIAYVASLPLAPVYAGVANAPLIARWCACLLLSGLITASMFLVMQLSIALS